MVVANVAGVNLRISKIFLRLCMLSKIDFNRTDRGHSKVDPNLIALFIMADLHLLIATFSINHEVIFQIFCLEEVESNTSESVAAVCSHLSISVKHRHLVSSLNLTNHQNTIRSD